MNIGIKATMQSYLKIKLKRRDRNFPGGPVAEIPLPMQGAQVPSLVRDLDPTCCN